MSFEEAQAPKSPVPATATPEASHDLEDAMKPVPLPLPKVKGAHHGEPVRTDRAPTVDEIMDPTQPSLEGASSKDVVDMIGQLVDDIYQEVLIRRLNDLKETLSQLPPPEPTPFAVQLLAWMVDMVAQTTIGALGKLAASALEGKGFTDSSAGVTNAAKSAGSAAGAAVKDMVKKRPTGSSESEARLGNPGKHMVDEFIDRQHKALLGKKHDANATLRLVRSNAAQTAGADLVELDSNLRALLTSPDLSGWFSHKVVMEWMNFVARVSMGPRDPGQYTDFPGANSLDGIPSTRDAYEKWQRGDGFVEITIEVPDDVDGASGLSIESARIPSSIGSAAVLRDSAIEVDASGKHLTLATLPVYRRIWLKTGDSKLSVASAFVITPDNEFEIETTNPVLAAIGAGHPVHVGEVVRFTGMDSAITDEGRKDPKEWSRRGLLLQQTASGAQIIHGMLQQVKPEVLK